MNKYFIIFGILCSFMASLGQYLFKISLKNLDINKLFNFSYLFSNKYFYIFLFSFVLYIAGFILWLYVLKNIELSSAVGFMILSYVLTFIYSIVLLRENINISKVIGLLLAVIGIFFIVK